MKYLIPLFLFMGSLAHGATAILMTNIDLKSTNDCWAELYSEPNFKGEKLLLMGEQIINDLDFPSDWSPMNSVQSVRTGPKAKLVLFGQEFRGDPSFFLTKDRDFPLIQNVPSYDDIDSVRMDCRDI